jgi:type IV pilus assembly protein PilQ
MRLSALEEEGVARTVSNPKLVTLDNQEAEISQGYEIPFATVSESGTQTEFKEAKLKLTVKPHITSSGDIVMDVEVSKDSPDFTHVTPDGVAIQTRSIKTSVRMKNGDTLVIGGIYEITKSNTNKEVPGLSRIPLLSWLFRHRAENLEKRELLIFITPTVAEASSTKSVQ